MPRLLATIALLCLLAPPAQAFPIAEGAGALSSLAGVIAAALTALFPKTSRLAPQRLKVLILAGLVMVAMTLGSLLWGYSVSIAAKDYTNIALQSRPALELRGEIEKRLAMQEVPEMSSKDQDYLEQHDVFFDLNAYRRGEIHANATRIYLGHKAQARSDQPYRSTLLLPEEDHAQLLEIARERQGNILLVADHPATVVSAARVLFEHTGFEVQGLALFSAEFSRPQERQTGGLPLVHDPARVFSLPIIDIRGRRDILETHTLINALNVPATDLLLYRDTELETLFPEGEQRVLISYDEADYPWVAPRLAQAVPGRYAFYAGGLKRHFFEDTLSIVPFYYNARSVDPLKLTEVYGLTGKVRFICTVPSQCLDNIPAADRIDIPFRDMEKADFADRIAALPRDALYVTVSSNQETSGNALMTGYWLVESGHDYLGDLVMQDRFSLEELRAIIGKELSDDATLEEFREAHATYLAVLDILRNAVRQHGWVLTFIALGAGFRLVLAPFQLVVSRSYYSARHSLPLTFLSALSIPAALIWGFYALQEAISYHAIIPHQVMNGLYAEQVQALLPSFIAMIAFQIAISFPTRPRMAILLIAGLCALWAFGLMDGLSLPLLVFLMSSEAVALCLQIPGFLLFLKAWNDMKAGVLSRPLPGLTNHLNAPEKWRLLTELEPQSGFLFDLASSDDTRAFRRALRRLRKSPDLILRSCDMDARENHLGGVYSSHVVPHDLGLIRDHLKSMRAEGCSHAWVQPFIAAKTAGVISSIGRNGQRAELTYGPPGAATEGGQAAQTCHLDTASARRAHRAEWKLLRRAEKRFKAPVILEYSHAGGRAIPHQVRLATHATHPEIALFPEGAQDLTLAEDFLASCSQLTGDVFCHVTQGQYVWLRGFLYRTRRQGRAYILLDHKKLTSLDHKATSLALRVASRGPGGPAEQLAIVNDTLAILSCLYRASQTRHRPKVMRTRYVPEALVCKTSELEVLACKSLSAADMLAAMDRQVDTRTHLHDLIVLMIYVLGQVVQRAFSEGEHDRLCLANLTETFPIAKLPSQQDELPLTSRSSGQVIVSGAINGSAWHIDCGIPPSDLEGPLVLIGTEIGSEWVRHLNRFAGIVSVYGHGNSHLGLSARALGIPYRTASAEDLSVFLSEGRLPSRAPERY